MRRAARACSRARTALDTLRMQRRFLRGHGLRLALTVVALALGVALVAAMDIVNRAVLVAGGADVRDEISRRLGPT